MDGEWKGREEGGGSAGLQIMLDGMEEGGGSAGLQIMLDGIAIVTVQWMVSGREGGGEGGRREGVVPACR